MNRLEIKELITQELLTGKTLFDLGFKALHGYCNFALYKQCKSCGLKVPKKFFAKGKGGVDVCPLCGLRLSTRSHFRNHQDKGNVFRY